MSVTATPEVVMLPGADVVNVSLSPKVCPWGVGVSICRVLAAAASMKPPLANRVMASARRCGDGGMLGDLVMASESTCIAEGSCRNVSKR